MLEAARTKSHASLFDAGSLAVTEKEKESQDSRVDIKDKKTMGFGRERSSAREIARLMLVSELTKKDPCKILRPKRKAPTLR